MKQSLSDISNADNMPFVREPPENFHVYLNASKDQEINQTNSSILTELYSFDEIEDKRKIKRGCVRSDSINSSFFFLDNFAPTMNEVEDLEVIERKDNYLGLYLWQRSAFYDKAKIDMNAWQLRWVQFEENKISCLPQRREVEPDDDIFMLPLITNLFKDNARLLIKATTTSNEECKFVPLYCSLLVIISILTTTSIVPCFPLQ